jgi:hypothetical protein
MTIAIRGVPRRFPVLLGAASARRFAVLCIALAVATLVSAPARAAAPMCSNDGRSVIAPPIVLPWHMVTLDAPAPCPKPDGLLVQSLPNDQPQSPSSPPTPAPLRAVPVRGAELVSAARSRSCVAALDVPSGHELVATHYRPPRG